MGEDWENLVIETGVDSMLDYLAENGAAPAEELSEKIGVDIDRIKDWADALDEENLVEKHYSMSSGLVLEYDENNVEETEKKKQDVEERLKERSNELKERLDDKAVFFDKQRNILSKSFEEEGERDQSVQETVHKLEELEAEIDVQLKNDKIDHETLELIKEIEQVLERVEELIKTQVSPEQNQELDRKADDALEEVKEVLDRAQGLEEFSNEEQQIRKELKAVDKLEKNIGKARSRSNSNSLLDKFKSLLPLEPGKDYVDQESKEKSGSVEPEAPDLEGEPDGDEELEENIFDDEDSSVKRPSLRSRLSGFVPVKKKSESSESQAEKENDKMVKYERSDGNDSKPVERPHVAIRESDKIRKQAVPEESYTELVDENKVTEVMRKISLIRSPDYKALLKAEKTNREREDLMRYLEERVEDVR